MVGFGTALAGYGAAQPEIRQQQEFQDKRKIQAAIAQAMMQKGQAPGGMMPAGAGAPVNPNQTPMPGMLPSTSPGGAPPPAPPGAPPALPGSSPTGVPSNPSQGFALPDFNKILAKITSLNMPDYAKGAALMEMMPLYATAASKQEQQRHDRAMEGWRGMQVEKERDWNDPSQRPAPRAAKATKTAPTVSKNDVVKAYTDWQADPTNKKLEDAYNAKREAFNSAKAKPAAKPSAGVTPEPQFDSNTIIQQAREAVKAGAPKDAVAKRLKDQGIMAPDDL